jgi:hypothetical protein
MFLDGSAGTRNQWRRFTAILLPMPQTSLDLTLPLAHHIMLTRGRGSHLVTLMDAAILIRDLEPWRSARPVWDRAAGLILLAAETRKRADIAEATRQLLVCLERENWKPRYIE